MSPPSTSPSTGPSTGPSTSPATGLPDSAYPPGNTFREWRRFSHFLARPTLPGYGASHARAIAPVFRMLGLDMLVMTVFIAALGAAAAAGFEPPENVNNTLGFTLQAVALVVIIAPVAEELIFRSWLSGHPAVMAAVAICVTGFGVVPWGVMWLDPANSMPAALFIGPGLTAVVAPLSAIALLRRSTPALYKRGFSVFFWLSCGGFALVHLGNYAEASLVILLPLVLPQFALGTMLGYLRVHYGLIHAIALHALHNGILFGLAMLGKSSAEAEAALVG